MTHEKVKTTVRVTEVDRGGVNVYIPRELTERHNITDGEIEIVENVTGNSIDIELGIESEGLTYEQAFNFLVDNQEFKILDQYQTEQEKYSTLEKDSIIVRVDNNYEIHNDMVNNITVESNPINVNSVDNAILFDELRSCIPENEKYYISVSDSEGIWNRLNASIDHSIESGEEVDIIKQIIKKIGSVQFTVKYNNNTICLSEPELEEVINTFEELNKNI